MATIERRVDKSGKIRYRARVRVRGAKARSRTFIRKTDTVTWAAKVEGDLGHGVYVPTTADRRRTLSDLIDKFVAEHLLLPVDASAVFPGRRHARGVFLDALRTKFSGSECQEIEARVAKTRKDGLARCKIGAETTFQARSGGGEDLRRKSSLS